MMQYNLRKRNVITYNVDKVYERIFENSDEEVKKCVFDDNDVAVVVEDCAWPKSRCVRVKRDVKDSGATLGGSDWDAFVRIQKKELLCHIRRGFVKIVRLTGEERIRVIFKLVENVITYLKLGNRREKDEHLRQVVIDKLYEFLIEAPLHKDKWEAYLVTLGC